MKKILILYHSSVGNTKMVAEKICNRLKNSFEIQLYSVEKVPSSLNLDDYHAVVIGFPTIHTHPTKRILKFIDELAVPQKAIPAFIFTTCGLYSANTLRIFSKHCSAKNILTIHHNAYRCAATDGVLLAPSVKFLFSHEKNLDHKVYKDCESFAAKLSSGNSHLSIPRFKFYSILNYPNKLLGQLITFPIYLHEARCIKCSKCVINCPSKALSQSTSGYPVFTAAKCEKCYRCIHHCPVKALSLSKKKTPQRVLTDNLE